jgi:GH15 family glucan-1,4-alpha-glucosidase
MAWVAFDRAVASATVFGLEGPIEHWRAEREAIREEVCREGFDRERNTFVQHYGGSTLDASLLAIPMTGFLPVDDPRVVGTVAAIERHLMQDGLLQRYSGHGEVDGLKGLEGAFLPCSFWLADVYHLMGREKEARGLFERLLGLRNDLGLLSEEYDPAAGRQLGNFPQAFSHVALINSVQAFGGAQASPARQRASGERAPA